MFAPVVGDPFAEGSFVHVEFSGDLRDGTGVQDDGLHGLILELGREFPPFLTHISSHSDWNDLRGFPVRETRGGSFRSNADVTCPARSYPYDCIDSCAFP